MLRGNVFRLVVGTLAISLCATAQNRPSSEKRNYVQGTVASVWNNQVFVNNGASVVPVTVDARTEIWKGKLFHDISPIQAGDRVFAACRLEAGKLVAESIQLNLFHTTGAAITSVTDSGFSVFTNPNADPHSAYRKENRIVEIDPDAFFEDSAREDIKPGRSADITGLELPDGKILATRITVFEGHHAVRFKGGRAVMPNGDIRTVLPNGQVVVVDR
jgi:hypothetical protein